MTEDELAEIVARCEAASAGPWYAHVTDDEYCQSAAYVSTQEAANGVKGFRHDNHRGLAEGDEYQIPPTIVIAITALQQPNLALMDDNKDDENALFIAHARTDMPRLVAEIHRLQHLLKKAQRMIDEISSAKDDPER